MGPRGLPGRQAHPRRARHRYRIRRHGLAVRRRRELRYRIESLAPGTAIVLCGTGAGMVSEERIELVADGDATTVEYRADFTLTGLLGWSKPAARALVERMTGAALAGLRDALEIDTTPPRQGWRDYIADRSMIAAAPSFTERGYLALDDKAHSEFMDDRVVVVTGATGGIGEAIAAEYARLGATTVIGPGAASGGGRDARARFRRLRGRARDHRSRPAGSRPDPRADALVGAHPRIDVLVNNAGACSPNARPRRTASSVRSRSTWSRRSC